MRLVAVLPLALVAAACSVGGASDDTRVEKRESEAPTSLQAEAAARRYLTGTRPEQAVVSVVCVSGISADAECTVQYSDGCDFLTVAREGNRFTVSRPNQYCLAVDTSRSGTND